MPYQFDVRVAPAMMRDAWNAWFFRGQRLLPLLPAAVALLAVAAYEHRHGTISTITIFGISALVAFLLMFGTAYFVGLRRSLSKLDSIDEGKATYTLTDSTVGAVSSIGSISLAWSSVAELRRYRGSILLGFKGAMYSTIPAAQIPDDALAFLIDRCRTAGARITGL